MTRPAPAWKFRTVAEAGGLSRPGLIATRLRRTGARPPGAGSAATRHRPGRSRWEIPALALLVLLGAAPVQRAAEAGAPAFNWVLPLFSDKEGHRLMTLRGTEVRPAGASIVVTNLSITVFSGDAAARVDSILLSPLAVFHPKENRASGDQSVRFIQDDVEVTGAKWSYDHAAKKVSLRENVRVTFRAKLNDILK